MLSFPQPGLGPSQSLPVLHQIFKGTLLSGQNSVFQALCFLLYQVIEIATWPITFFFLWKAVLEAKILTLGYL